MDDRHSGSMAESDAAAITNGNAAPAGMGRTYARNVVVTGFSLVVSVGIGLLLPAFLTHRLSTASYGAWILILQIASYVGLLDFGIQTAIAKYIAEHAVSANSLNCKRYASAGTTITVILGTVGLGLTGALALLVPVLFRTVPLDLRQDVIHGVLLVGCSTAVLLACSSFAAFFRGLQRFAVPSIITIASKVVYLVVLLVLSGRHASLTTMGAAVAVVNVLTAFVQVGAWRLLLPEIGISVRLVEWPIVKQMLSYCAVLGLWTGGMLIIMGLDLTVVGHYDFAATAYYAVASSPITFLLLLLQAALNPLMPAVSALSVSRSASEMGDLLRRSTRYIVLLLEVGGLPLILFGYIVLFYWVGPNYAQRSLPLLRILMLAQIIRNLFGPYATMVIATGEQKHATASGLSEAAVNLVFSILLGKLYGAWGVAMGTLIGAVVGVMVHLLVSMRRTHGRFAVSAGRLIRDGWLRPAVAALPSLALLPFFWRPLFPPHAWWLMLLWALSSLALAWRFALDPSDRATLIARVARPAQRPESATIEE